MPIRTNLKDSSVPHDVAQALDDPDEGFVVVVAAGGLGDVEKLRDDMLAHESAF